MIRIIERRGQYQLGCYPRAGWIVIKLAPDGSIETIVVNGKFDDVFERYRKETANA